MSKTSKFEAVVEYVHNVTGLRGKRTWPLARTILETGDVSVSARYNRLARAAKTQGYKRPFAIARALLTDSEVAELNSNR